jgi:glycine hydroxymethyltransferase
MHVVAAKAVAFHEAMTPEFKSYQKQILKNSQELAKALQKFGFRIVSGGTDTHLMLVDLSSKSVTGSDASLLLGQAGITVNKNLIPFDKKSPMVTSGIRLGTAAVTTRGLKEAQMQLIASLINEVIEANADSIKLSAIRKKVLELTKKFPLYPELAR